MTADAAERATGAIVLACYRPKPGRDEALSELIGRHVTLLREHGLATQRDVVLLRSREDGTFIEIFEWISDAHAERAHHVPEVAALWAEMTECAEFCSLGALAEASRRFPHFDSVAGITR